VDADKHDHDASITPDPSRHQIRPPERSHREEPEQSQVLGDHDRAKALSIGRRKTTMSAASTGLINTVQVAADLHSSPQ
jgi:hypothetical protein